MSSALELSVVEPKTFDDPDTWQVEPGASHPFGAHVVDDGVNFAVFAENADSVDLLLFARPEDPYPARIFLPPVEGRHWLRAFDTSLAAPFDASEPGEEPLFSGASYPAGPRSAVILVSGEE
jgi:hypothetical protein